MANCKTGNSQQGNYGEEYSLHTEPKLLLSFHGLEAHLLDDSYVFGHVKRATERNNGTQCTPLSRGVDWPPRPRDWEARFATLVGLSVQIGLSVPDPLVPLFMLNRGTRPNIPADEDNGCGISLFGEL